MLSVFGLIWFDVCDCSGHLTRKDHDRPKLSSKPESISWLKIRFATGEWRWFEGECIEQHEEYTKEDWPYKFNEAFSNRRNDVDQTCSMILKAMKDNTKVAAVLCWHSFFCFNFFNI